MTFASRTTIKTTLDKPMHDSKQMLVERFYRHVPERNMPAIDHNGKHGGPHGVFFQTKKQQ